jgi:hypothetical protein
MKKQIISLIILALLPLVANAETVEIDGIYYNLIHKGKVAEVTSNPYKYTGSVVIPETVTYNDVTYDVTSIGESAFSSCWNMTNVIIPNSVTNIGAGAFRGCGLNSINIPNSVTSIGGQAFRESHLTSITFSTPLPSFGPYVFLTCENLNEVHISNLEEWCKYNFNSGSNPLENAHHLYLDGEEIKELIIPNSVNSIGDRAFCGCSSLTSITIPNSVTNIGEFAFSGCSGLTNITIPNTLTKIGEYAFSGCSGLTSINIPNSITGIGQKMFQGCTSLTSVTIPNTVSSIGYCAFANCI